MSKPTSLRVLLRHTLLQMRLRVFLAVLTLVVLTPVITAVYSITRGDAPRVLAANPATLNFQARLLNSSGSLVPDGIYNVEFKLYNAATSAGSSQGSCAGDANCLWSETRLTSDAANLQIEVKNGYFSAYLGDKTALPTNIWNQQLWLTMNIGGVGIATWDGEMSPRIRLTSVPFAFRATTADTAETLSKNTGSFTGTVEFATMTADRKFLFPDTSLATTASPGTICVYNGAASNCPAASGSAYYLQNDTVLQTQTNFHIQARDSGVNGTIGGVITGAAAGQTADLLQFRASDDTTVLAAVTADGNLQIASSIDTRAAGALSIGTATATSIGIGKAGITTTINGALTVAEAATFSSTVNINGLATLAAGLTVTNGGNVSFQKGGDYSTVGSQNDVDFGTGALFRLTGLSAQTITGITGGVDGRRITLINAGSTAATIANLNGASASTNQITTGTGGDLTVPVGASIELIYDSSSTVWRVTGGSAASGGAGVNTVGTFSNTSIANGASISGTTITFGAADVTNPGMVSIGTQTFGGDKTFQGTLTVGNATATDDQLITAITTGGTDRFTGTVTNADLTANQTYTLPNATGTVITTGNLTDITTVGTITAGTWNGTALTDAYISNTITIDATGTVDWAALNNYPAACAAGSAVTQLDDTVTCSTFAVGTAADYIQNQDAAAQATSTFWISGTGRADTSLLTPVLDTATATALGVGTTTATAVNISKAGAITTINGALTVSEAATFNGDVTIAAGKYIQLTGGNTASRPASPTEGMLYYDTDTKQLLIYANGKWQADRSEAIIVAASNSSQANKDAADFIADGNTGAAGDGDQVQINQALTAASGKKVVLLAGTYIVDASISVPNNTTLAGVGNGTLIEFAALGDSVSENMIENADTTTGTGIAVRDMRLNGRTDLNPSGGWQVGITLAGMGGGSGGSTRPGATVSGMDIRGFQGSSIFLDTAMHNTITGNYMDAPIPGWTIFGDEASRNKIVGNTSRGGNGIQLDNSDYNVISNNVGLENDQYAGVAIFIGNGNTITNNSIDSAIVGIDVQGDNNTVVNNTIINSTTKSIDINGTANYIAGNTLGGDPVDDSGTGTIYGGQTNAAGNFLIQPAGTIELMQNTNVSGTMTVSQLLTGQAGLDVTGGVVNLNASSNFNTNINTGTSTGSVTIGNAAAGAISLQSGSTISLVSGTTLGLTSTGANNINITPGGASDTGVLIKPTVDSAAAVQIQNIAGAAVFTADTTNGQVVLGTSNALSGKMVFKTSGDANSITLSAPSTVSASYSLALPQTTPTTGLCLATANTNANQLVFTSCFQQVSNAPISRVNGWSNNGSNITTINVSPAGPGNLMVFSAGFQNNQSIVSISGGGVTSWQPITSGHSGTGSLKSVELWRGVVTSTGASTITVTFSGSAGTTDFAVDEYTMNSAYGTWSIDTSSTQFNSGASTTVTYPSLLPQSNNELYAGYALLGGTPGIPGSCSAGFTCRTTTGGMVAYSTASTSGVPSSPTGTQTTSASSYTIGATIIAFANNNVIINSTTGQLGNFNVTAATAGSVAGIVQAASSGTADIFQLKDGAGALVGTFSSSGAVLFKNSANSTTAFQVQNQAGASIFNVDTTNAKIGTRNETAASTNSAVLTIKSGDVTGATSNSGNVVLASGNATGTSGNLTVDVGTGAATGSISIGTANASAISIGKVGVTTTNNGNFTIGASAGSGTTFTNNGATLNSVRAVADDSDGGSLGGTPGTPLTAAQSVDIYTSFTVNQTTASQTITIPSPTNTAAGRIIYIANIGTAGFSLLGSTLNAGATATLLWNGTAWTFAGADGTSINNQKAAGQNGDFWIQSGGSSTGIGRADGGFQAPSLDAATAAALSIGTANATDITIGHNAGTFAVDGTNFDLSTAGILTLAGGQTNDITTQTNQNLTLQANGSGTINLNDSVSIFDTVTFSGVATDITTGANQDLTVVANGTGTIVLNDTVTAAGTVTISGVATDITTGTNEDLTIVANGTGTIVLNDTVSTNGTVTFNGVPTDITTGTNEDFTIVANGTGVINLDDNVTVGGDLTFAEGANRQISVAARSTAGVGYNLTVVAGGANGSDNAGGALNLQGGAAVAGNATGGAVALTGGIGFGTGNGGAITISGGAGGASGAQGLVSLSTTAFTSSGTFTTTVLPPSVNTIVTSDVNQFSTIPVNAHNATAIVSVPDPTIITTGRVLYITALNTSTDFTLRLNAASPAPIDIAMKKNSTATLVWNGDEWTAAGASSSTDLQSAYNNTLTSAGGAEIVLNPVGGNADGFTIRNNGTTPITGGLLEVQTSIGSNLLSVNNNATEYAVNGGAESATLTGWGSAPAGGTATKYTTAGDNIATGQASVFADTSSTANTGVKNTLNSSLTQNLKYKVSFSTRNATATPTFTTLQVIYSADGASSTATCSTNNGATTSFTSYYNVWTRVDCTFTATSVGASNAIVIRHSDGLEHDFYIDNLSVTVGADVNHAADGDADSTANIGAGTNNWGVISSSTVSQVTSPIYNTNGAVSVVTSATAGRGVYNKLANNITPTASSNTLVYRVSFYARGDGTNTANLDVKYSADGSNNADCLDFNTQTISATVYTLISCYFTTNNTTPDSNAQLKITQTGGSATNFYVDGLAVNLNSNTSSNVQIGGANKGGPTTLLTLDRASSAPIAANNDAYLGSMYYDTTTGRIQCYEADGWGACGSSPDIFVTLTPEYTGAVLNGTGIGVMTADFCGNGAGLGVNTTLCSASGTSRQYYKWTSPQATEQVYSIFVSYKLPTTFKSFTSDDTINLTARTSDTATGHVTYEVFRSTGSAITACGSATGVTNTTDGSDYWSTKPVNGNESTSCGFAAGDNVVFKINMKSYSNANVYVENLTFTYNNN